MSSPTFGISINRINNEPLPAVGSDLSVIGLCVADDTANATTFPLNTPVQIFSDDPAALSAAGTGALATAIEGINDQLGEFQVAARIVVVRVAEGDTEDETIANVAGSSLNNSGIWAFTLAGPRLGIIPRILVTPNVTADFIPASGGDPAEGNAVVAELADVCPRLLAHAIVSGPTDTMLNWTNWRETIQSDRIIPIATAVKVGSPSVTQDAAPRIAGIAVRRDHEKGGLPFWSWANQPLAGIVGVNRELGFSLTDGATEGQQLLSQNAGIIVRGQMGVEQAIASGGFVYVGTDNCSEDPLWQFYNVSRGRDYIHLMFLRTLRFYLGRYNISGHTIEAVTNTMKIALRDLQAQDAILGYKVGFTRDLNSPENIRMGRFNVSFAAEEASVLRHLGIQSSRYRPAIDALLDELVVTLSSVA